MSTSVSNPGDIPELVKLINRAYRGEESKKGWTTEAWVLDGDLRIDAPALENILDRQGTAIIKYTNPAGVIEGCVFVEIKEKGLYFGMLSVIPGLQDKGIGKKLMKAVEAFATTHQCDVVFMRVISIRHELIAWYERRGYHLTGETEPMPEDRRFGVPNRPLEFVVMEKSL